MKQKNILFILVIFSIIISGCNQITQEPNLFQNSTLQGNFKMFSDLDELENFIQVENQNMLYRSKNVMVESAAMDSDSGSVDFSETNIQVQGVDEADIVKTDGKYIYYITQNSLFIIESKEIISEIKFENKNLNEIFIYENKIAVIGIENMNFEKMARSSYYEPKTIISVFDVEQKENPVLEEEIKTDGHYFNSRLIGQYMYVIVNQPMYPGIGLPIIQYRGGERKINANQIGYFDFQYSSHQLSIILAIDLEDNTFEQKTILKDSSQDMFVSKDNIYLINRKFIPYHYEQKKIIDEVMTKYLPSDIVDRIKEISSYDLREQTIINEIEYLVQNYIFSLPKEQRDDLEKQTEKEIEKIREEIRKEREKTIINKISISEKNIEFVTGGEVAGYVLNQFSMDEFKGNFRIATTTGNMWDGSSSNNLFILNENLELIGEIINIAPEERIYSVRFMGEKAYMVTFRDIDPFFVLDLENPTEPKILGELKIPGYSDYLHPYDENHIIGIGKSTDYDAQKDRVILEGLKLALFDVSDVTNPKEIAKVEIGDRGTDSDALYNHKSFLFDRTRNLLVLPVRVTKLTDEFRWGQFEFQGAYVYNLTPENGFDLVGTITHLEKQEYSFEENILRSLYIDNVLYTLSRRIIKANDLDNNLEEINKLELYEKKEYEEPIYYY